MKWRDPLSRWRCSGLHTDQPPRRIWHHKLRWIGATHLCLTGESSLHLHRSRWAAANRRSNFSDPRSLSLGAAAALHLAGAGGCHCLSLPLLNLKKTSRAWKTLLIYLRLPERWGWRQRPGPGKAPLASSGAIAAPGMLLTGEQEPHLESCASCPRWNMSPVCVCIPILMCACVCVCLRGCVFSVGLWIVEKLNHPRKLFQSQFPHLVWAFTWMDVHTLWKYTARNIWPQRVKAPPSVRGKINGGYIWRSPVTQQIPHKITNPGISFIY